jgi:hypothetical protein
MSSFFLKKTRGVTPYCAFIKNKENKLYAKGEKEKKTEKKGINGKQTPSMSEDFEML